MSELNPQPLLRNFGVYAIEADEFGERPIEHLVAILNDDLGDYLYALPRAVPIPGGGFAYDDRETLIFVEKNSGIYLFTSYYDSERLYEGQPITILKDTGLTAISATSAGLQLD